MDRWYPHFWQVPRSWRLWSWAMLLMIGIAASDAHGLGRDVLTWLAVPFVIIPVADVVVAVRQEYVDWLYVRNRF